MKNCSFFQKMILQVILKLFQQKSNWATLCALARVIMRVRSSRTFYFNKRNVQLSLRYRTLADMNWERNWKVRSFFVVCSFFFDSRCSLGRKLKSTKVESCLIAIIFEHSILQSFCFWEDLCGGWINVV